LFGASILQPSKTEVPLQQPTLFA